MLPAALEYPWGDWNGFRVYRPVGRSFEHFGCVQDYKLNTFER